MTVSFIPERLIENISNGDAVVFLGSDFLQPSRVLYLNTIKELINYETREVKSSKEIVKEYPIDDRIEEMKEVYEQLRSLDAYLSKYGIRKLDTTTKKKLLNSVKHALRDFHLPTKGVGNKSENNGSSELEELRLRKQLNESIHFVEQQIKNYGNIVESAKSGPKFDNLSAYIEMMWPTSNSGYISDLIANLGKVNSLITTIFGPMIENAILNMKKSVKVVTGIESTQLDSDSNKTGYDFLLYKILGTLDKTYTLRISDSSSDDYGMWRLRDEIANSDKARNFLVDLIKDKTLVLLGYNDHVLYDVFFREIINDTSYITSNILARDIYLVNKSTYDTYTGIWGLGKDYRPVIDIGLTPAEFTKELVRSIHARTA